MGPSWYVYEEVARSQHAEMLHIAQEERRAREAQRGQERAPLWPRLYQWLDQQAEPVRRRFTSWVSRATSLASQKYSYLDNPDPFRNCATC